MKKRWREQRARRALHRPLKINGVKPADFIKLAYDLGVDLKGPGRYDLSDPIQTELRRVSDWVKMAEHDALESRRG